MRQLLTDRLVALLGDDAQRHIRRLGAHWFAENGHAEAAIKQYLAAGDEEEATYLLYRHLGDIIDNDFSRRTLRHLLSMFPSRRRRGHPILLLADIYIKCQHWDMAGLSSLLHETDRRLSNPRRALPEVLVEKLRIELDSPRTLFLYWAGDLDGALAAGRRVLENTPEEKHHERVHAMMYLPAALFMLGREEEADQHLDKYIAKALDAGSGFAGALLFAKMSLCYYGADAAGARAVSENIIDLHRRRAVHTYWYCHCLHLLGCVEYEQSRLDEAEHLFEELRTLRYQITSRLGHDGLLGLALISMARQDWDEAEKRAEFARAYAFEVKDSASIMYSEFFRTRAMVTKGDPTSYATVHQPEAMWGHLWLENPVLTYAEYLIASSDRAQHEAALAAIEKARRVVAEKNSRRQLIQLEAVRATVLHRLGHTTAAQVAILDVLSVAGPLGMVRTFVDRGRPMQALLSQIAASDPKNDYVATLLRAFDRAGAVSTKEPISKRGENNDASPKRLSLSRRELEVLAHLEGVASLKEIADAMHVSAETIKKHTFRIYRKLGVNGRFQAVEAAKRLGLFSRRRPLLL